MWIGITFIVVENMHTGSNNDAQANQIVALNEIEQLIKSSISTDKTNQITEIETKIKDIQKDIQNNSTSSQNTDMILLGSFTIICGMSLVLGYIYIKIIVPFSEMEKYAAEVAKGNLETSLSVERSNYFGAFTWAFDHMRKEIINARTNEKQAIDNNKTVIATLSHDIKTPIASIRAYAEGLEANMDTNQEKRKMYTNVIMNKCDEVAKLTDDLFLHSLSDLKRIHVNLETLDIVSLLSSTIYELSIQQRDVEFIGNNARIYANVDRKRFIQVIENIVNNARKYAKTKIEITLKQKENTIFIHIRDYGQGIPDKDMPFIFEKFYRGENVNDEQGSGLGLFIVEYIMHQMHGNVTLHNHEVGLEVILRLPNING